MEIAIIANRLITKDLLKNEKKRYERFSNDCKVTQCFNCQSYRDVLKVCCNTAKCSHCAGNHTGHNCITKFNWCCINCNTASHKAWFKICGVKNAQKQHSKEAYQNKPLIYLSTITFPSNTSFLAINTNAFNFALTTATT